ncbi:hypothetical protein BsWGS_00206 [Bradybaena similaris]
MEAGHVKDVTRMYEATTLRRLQGQVIRGMARHEHCAGGQRSLVNQHKMGVVRHYTLEDLLRRRSEYLWVNGFMYSKDDLSANCHYIPVFQALFPWNYYVVHVCIQLGIKCYK